MKQKLKFKTYSFDQGDNDKKGDEDQFPLDFTKLI